jgi:phospholipase/carboxylesterase
VTGELDGFPYRFVPAEDAHAPTLLLLHGTGADEDDLVPLGRHLQADGALISPRGKVREHGAPRWFRRLSEGVFDTEDIKVRAAELAGFVDRAATEHHLDARDVVAVGFSNGANIAAALLVLHPQVLRGAILFSSMLPLHPDTLPDLSHAAVFMSAGRVDPMAPADQAESLARLLTDAGASVTVHWHDTGHGIDMAQVERARAWLTKLRAATGSGEGSLP